VGKERAVTGRQVQRRHRVATSGRPLFLSAAALAALASGGCAATPPAASAHVLQSPPRPVTQSPVGPIDTIVIDAGHGGHDPGTSHFGLKEKNLVLDIARRLRGHLQQAGLSVVMTRDSDKFIPLSGRPAVANRLGADLFVSVHVNANKSRRISGIEVYYPRSSVVSSSSQWPPGVSSSDVAVPSTTVKQVLWDLVLSRTRTQSRRLGQTICHTMKDGLQAPCRFVKPARFVVLRESWMPSVLVEVGYVTNQTEASRLGSAQYREAAARSIAAGIIKYIREQGAQHI
jgi:N-acetylmuramoyl-L-alanine amidase